MMIPEIFKALKNLFSKKLLPDVLPVATFIILGLYTLTLFLVNEKNYVLFGLLYAIISIPTLLASLYRTKADFLAFKKIAALEEKQVIDIQNTRELEVENKALDGVIDEYKSKQLQCFLYLRFL